MKSERRERERESKRGDEGSVKQKKREQQGRRVREREKADKVWSNSITAGTYPELSLDSLKQQRRPFKPSNDQVFFFSLKA